jgi:porphobilinogen synthase
MRKQQADFVALVIWWTGVCAFASGLDAAGFQNVGIMSYSAKYCFGVLRAISWCFRQRTRIRCGSAKDKKTYQMDYANRIEAIKKPFGMLKKVLIW